jgi:hypothetical protein
MWLRRLLTSQQPERRWGYEREREEQGGEVKEGVGIRYCP